MNRTPRFPHRRAAMKSASALLGLALTVSLLPCPSADAAETVPEWAKPVISPTARLQESLPEHYDLRDRGLVTPAKYQNPFNSCWAFGGISAAETSILSTSGQTYQEYPLDLSEKHLIWFATHPVTEADADDTQAGEGLYFKPEDPNGTGIYNDGGKAIYFTSLFSSGVGPVLEEIFPYQGSEGLTKADVMERDKEEVKISIRQNILNEFTEEGKEPPLFEDIIPELREPYASMTSEGEILEYIFQEELADLRANDCFSDTDNWSIDSTDEMGYSNRNLTIGYTLRDGNILPPLAQFDEDNNWCGVNPAGVQAVKEELYAGRGVSISIYADQSRPDENNQAEYLNQNTWSQYTCTEKDTNHRVSIIGWDDTYSRNKFNNGTTPDGEDRTPPGDGAWIIKNSWGSEDE